MASKQDRTLKNPRVRRMLLMIDDADKQVATSSGLTSNRNCANIVQESKSVESLSIKPITEYNLRDLPKKKYADCDRDVGDADFCPDCSEYVPSPERIAVNSPSSTFSGHNADSQCIHRILNTSKVIDTPSTISNLLLLLTNSDFIAFSTTIYKINNEHSSIIDAVQYNKEKQFANLSLVPSYPLADNLSSGEFEETLQPESSPKVNKTDVNMSVDITLTESSQNEHCNFRTELTRHSLEFEPSNLDKPSTSQNEKKKTQKNCN